MSNAPRRWSPYFYRFTSVWELPAPPEAVYRALARPEEYPRWWPEVRAARRLDERSAELRVRSVLPYELRVLLREVRQDPAAGVLEAELGGDLDGATRWTVLSRGDGAAVAVFQEEVVARHQLLRRFALPGRPFFRANHAVMMRRGEAALRARLAAPASRSAPGQPRHRAHPGGGEQQGVR